MREENALVLRWNVSSNFTNDVYVRYLRPVLFHRKRPYLQHHQLFYRFYPHEPWMGHVPSQSHVSSAESVVLAISEGHAE